MIKDKKSSRAAKSKGYRGEIAVVKQAEALGIDCTRAFASRGKAIGLPETVDVVLDGQSFQVKNYRALPKYLKIPDELSGMIMKSDREPFVVVLRLTQFLEMKKWLKSSQQSTGSAS